jgi:outer membrane lipoprotein-sorting protein
MSMRIIEHYARAAIVALNLALVFVAPVFASRDISDLLRKMGDALVPGTNLHADVDLTMTSEKGEKVSWEGEIYRRGGDAAVRRFVFEEPRDIRGVELVLTRSEGDLDRMKMYLPVLRRVRDIRTELQGEPFLGTDFNFEDLGFDETDFRKHAIAGKGEFEGRSCVNVKSTPNEPFGYGSIVRCIDEKDFLPRRTEYYDRAGKLWKLRTLERIEKIDGKAVPTRIVMKDVQTGTSSTLELANVRLDAELAESAFRIGGSKS